MFKRIMVPVDLAHLARLGRALEVAGDLARHYGAEVTYVSVTAPTPGAVAHTPAEFAEKLAAFARTEGDRRGIGVSILPLVGHDPTTDTDDMLMRAVADTRADLVVMASHKPGLADYFWPSNGGKIAAHSGVSVMLVRDV